MSVVIIINVLCFGGIDDLETLVRSNQVAIKSLYINGIWTASHIALTNRLCPQEHSFITHHQAGPL